MKTIAATLAALAALLLALTVNRQSDRAAALAAEYMAHKIGPYGQLMEMRQAGGGNALGLLGVIVLAIGVAAAVAVIINLKARADREARLLARARKARRPAPVVAMPPAQPQVAQVQHLTPWAGGED